MRREAVGLSWLDGRLEVAWPAGRGSSGRWTAPRPVETAAALGAALREARAELGFGSGRAAMVFDARQLLFHVQDAPPVRGRLLVQLLDRLVAEQGFFPGPAVWSHLPLPPSGARARWLMAVLPRSILDEIQAACAGEGLELEGVYPFAALLGRWLPRASAGTEGPVLVMAGHGDSHSLLVADGEGRWLFARSLVETADRLADRLEQEVRRTLSFCQQRFGAAVRRAVIVGPAGRNGWADRLRREGFQVDCLDEGIEPGETAAMAARWGGGAPFNLARAPGALPDWVAPAVTTGTAVLAVLAALLVVGVETAVRSRERQADAARQRALVARQEAAVRDREVREARRLEALLRTFGQPERPGVPLAFSQYVRSVVPEVVRLTRLDLARTTNGWTLHLEGASREAGSRFLGALETFETALEDGAFRVVVTDSTHRRMTGRTAPEGGPRVAVSSTRRVEAGERPFFLSGQIP